MRLCLRLSLFRRPILVLMVLVLELVLWGMACVLSICVDSCTALGALHSLEEDLGSAQGAKSKEVRPTWPATRSSKLRLT